FYPGEYNVSLEYYMNYYGTMPDASDQMIIKVVSTDFLISAVGNEKDFFVELSNNTNYDADISNWILASTRKSFVMPRNTIIGSKKKIVFSSKITGFSLEDKKTLKLMTPQGELIFDYGASMVVPITTAPVPAKISIQKKISPVAVQSLEKIVSISKEQIPTSTGLSLNESGENILASVVSRDVVKDYPIRAYILTFILTIFIGVSAGVVYFIRQKRTVFKAGDDFKILD
ncbi:MAG: hypothetical protein Q8O89_04110, partial [Nanoarchaeota archaeon]|nr:hypothetical protein [Nanoarchaeota archaeon]